MPKLNLQNVYITLEYPHFTQKISVWGETANPFAKWKSDVNLLSQCKHARTLPIISYY